MKSCFQLASSCFCIQVACVTLHAHIYTTCGMCCTTLGQSSDVHIGCQAVVQHAESISSLTSVVCGSLPVALEPMSAPTTWPPMSVSVMLRGNGFGPTTVWLPAMPHNFHDAPWQGCPEFMQHGPLPTDCTVGGAGLGALKLQIAPHLNWVRACATCT